MIGILTNLIMEYVEVDESALTRETDPVRDLHLNSYDLMSILGRIESDLGIEISERELRGVITLGDLDDYIRGKLAA
jgi:acyl carrier protein